MKKVLLGLANNISLHQEKISLWSKSFKKYSDADIVLLGANMSDEDIKTCEALSLPYTQVIVKDTYYINHKRLEHILEFIKQQDYDLFLVTDVFDVAFQADPFSKLDYNNFDFFVSGEGINVGQEPWNMDNISKIFSGEVANQCRNNEIICSGVIAGKKEALLTVYEKMFNLCESGSDAHNIKDQAALIVLIVNNEIPRMKIFNLDDGWAMHCAVAGPTQFFSAWGFDNSIKYGIPKMIDKTVCTGDGRTYDIVHQFNRVPEWHDLIKGKYENE